MKMLSPKDTYTMLIKNQQFKKYSKCYVTANHPTMEERNIYSYFTHPVRTSYNNSNKSLATHLKQTTIDSPLPGSDSSTAPSPHADTTRYLIIPTKAQTIVRFAAQNAR